MAAEHQYFYEDVVYRLSKRGHIQLGMVMENAEFVSSDEDSDDEDRVKVKKGRIRVIWHSTGAEEIVSEKKVGLADRSLMPGDVVRRMIKGKDTQRGYCRHVNVETCVQVVGSRHIITNVNSRDLVPIEKISENIAVYLDSWVGGVKSVHSKLFLKLPDNSRCVLTDPEDVGFDVFDEKKCPDASFPHKGDYYPGQVLWGPMDVLANAEWLNSSKDNKAALTKSSKNVKVLVENVEVESVSVHWQCRAYSKDGISVVKEHPKFLVQGNDVKRLKLLNVFDPCTIQVGDRSVYTLEPVDVIISKDEWRRQQKKAILNRSVSSPPPLIFKRRKTNKESHKNIQENGYEVNMDDLTNHDGKPNESPCAGPYRTDEGEWCTESSDSQSEACSNASSSAASGVSSSSKKMKTSIAVIKLTKALHKKKLKRAVVKKSPSPISLEPGAKVVVETVSTTSTADVVWQDGSIEKGIPSTELYPIHHLDDQEFFPGDFVIENRDEACMRVYGVIQTVDHFGRTACVKWFKTYTSAESPVPTFLYENEVSAYDLKDHPDFQYRPGTVVIRIANFRNENSGTVGQVLDNYPEGKVKVWWVEGSIIMCWPQDLYKVGEYDSDDGDFWDNCSSDEGSWQTESEECFHDDENAVEEKSSTEDNLKPKLATNIESAWFAMKNLENMFKRDPSLQTTVVMKKLLDVYKDCRYLDKLMGTSFFHESHFQGLLERVREKGRANVAQKVANQVQRLFSENEGQGGEEKMNDEGDFEKGEFCDSCLTQKITDIESNVIAVTPEISLSDASSIQNGNDASMSNSESVQNNLSSGGAEKKCCETSSCNTHVCEKLCSLILDQLIKAHSEVIRRYGGNTGSLAEAFYSLSPNHTASPQIQKQENSEVVSGSPIVPETELKVEEEVVEQPLAVEVSVNGNTELADDPEQITVISPKGGAFSIMDSAPYSHKFKLTMFEPHNMKMFFKNVKQEIKLLKSSLPTGIWVKGFEDRMDLFSVMIRGPEKTPYEDGLFFFDFQLSKSYPSNPPQCHYISYCSDRLNPNLYENGTVCVSLLGTWTGKGTECWTPTSTLLQVFVSIQGLILVSEPYFNEAGYDKQKGTQQGKENSRMYNEMAVLKLVQAMTNIVNSPYHIFKEEITAHLKQHAPKFLQRLESWLELSEQYNNTHPLSPTTPTSFREWNDPNVPIPEFPLIPASKGFCLSLKKSLFDFKQVLIQHELLDGAS